MDKWTELNDFSMFEGSIPCILCQADSAKTLLGDHWKCSVCSHVFNKDGSDIKVQCYCEKCLSKKQKESAERDERMQAALQKLNDDLQKIDRHKAQKSKPKKKSTKKKK